MTELSSTILKFMEEHNIKNEEILRTLENSYMEISDGLWEKVCISLNILYILKNTIWYNFEYLDSSTQKFGLTTLKSLGQKFPIIAYHLDDIGYVDKDLMQDLYKELLEIKKLWNKNIHIASLFSPNCEDWMGGDINPSPVIIYDAETEKPQKYGYNSNENIYTSFYDIAGNKLKQYSENMVLCSIKKINEYSEYSLMTQMLNTLQEAVNNAIKNNKGLYLDFNGYDYA